MFSELDEIQREILRKYKTALSYIGVDFSREDVREAIIDTAIGLEAAFQAIISYWRWKQQHNEPLEYPSAFLIKALSNLWQPKDWQEEYLDNPNFKSLGQLWWEEAEEVWGRETRNYWVANFTETDTGEEYILFRSQKTLPLRLARVWGWQRVLDYARDLSE
jgi:hypothetical protein